MKVLDVANMLAMTATMVTAFPVTADSLNCRAEPNTSSAVKKTYKKTEDVKISCQTDGPSINGNSIWDKTQDGCYVADYYIKTGSSGYVTGKCGGGGGGSNPPPSGGFCKTLNKAGTDLITRWEGFVDRPKPDPIGLPTVGYGHLCQKKSCAEVKYTFPLTKATALQLLNDDLPSYTKCLGRVLDAGKVKLNENQWAALTSWVFNVGCGAAQSSSLVKRLNRGENANTVASEELPKWKMGGGRVLPGLVKRRADEVGLFKIASSRSAFPQCQ
ncbi:Endolysin [Metarhizium anisopliae]|nr:Endolysin [Metarhizium anisopliae]